MLAGMMRMRLSAVASIGLMLCGMSGRAVRSAESSIRTDGFDEAARGLAGENGGYAMLYAPGFRKSTLTERQANHRRRRNQIAAASRKRNRAA
jgi:hypothetical protein